MGIEYFVIGAGLPKGSDSGSEITVSCAMSPRQAHEFAMEDFRKKRNLPSSVQVLTSTLHRCETEGEAVIFLNKLIAKMDYHKAAKNIIETSAEAT